ncbi:hypothetical protein AV274_1163 [Blastocystis sp. ATCC 50177/Nand II]|uniref:Acyltransferase C-terminal domain-containing protein n=1 Tax=Blastocystis sp. subtype 1 (strain ATCC 50177 / NandII) TaxID=478820 RepID=A0A196SLQ3_BLAHN|nr:hypothetical protein AV274_1163 [Blastocystis sp. ATCC 50177/Nand II]
MFLTLIPIHMKIGEKELRGRSGVCAISGICQDDYTRVVDTTFPDVDNSFWSRRPIHCHIHVNVVPISDILSDDAKNMEEAGKEVEKWLDQSWIEKEKQLEYFTKHQTYDDEWNVNRKVENFDFAHRVKDSIPWVGLALGALCLDYVCIKGVSWLYHSIVGLF